MSLNDSFQENIKEGTITWLVAIFLALAVPSVLLGGLFLILGEERYLLSYLALPLQPLAFLLIALWRLRTNFTSLKSLGLSLNHLRNSLGIGIISGFAYFQFNQILTLLSLSILSQYMTPQNLNALQQQEQLGVLQEFIDNLGSFWTVGYLGIIIGLLAPIAEELFFRGYLYTTIKHRYGKWAGAIASSFLFALIHFYIINFMPLFVLGLLLTYLYEKSNSIITPIIAHSIYNIIILILIVYAGALL